MINKAWQFRVAWPGIELQIYNNAIYDKIIIHIDESNLHRRNIWHCSDVTMSWMASQITGVSIVWLIAQWWPVVPLTKSSSAENVSIWWRHHDTLRYTLSVSCIPKKKCFFFRHVCAIVMWLKSKLVASFDETYTNINACLSKQYSAHGPSMFKLLVDDLAWSTNVLIIKILCAVSST